jgi:NAD(P)-dependent dehydrogenase (short-subunit alcohol dehydrogenase family)
MNSVAVITGGAGGMGLAAAKIVGRTHRVMICDVSDERLDTASKELAQLGIACSTSVCDIADRRSVSDLVRTSTELGTIVAIVHAAGVSPSMGSAERIMRINAVGTVNVNESFLRATPGPFAIVNVASMAAHLLPGVLIPRRRFACALQDEDRFMSAMMSLCAIAPRRLRPGLAYSISKSFVTWYSASQAGRFGRRGARILSVSPGSIDTAMGRLEEGKGSGAMAAHSALHRFGTAEEVAELLAFCVSERAGYLTGVDILCDGGTVASMTLRDRILASRDA